MANECMDVLMDPNEAERQNDAPHDWLEYTWVETYISPEAMERDPDGRPTRCEDCGATPALATVVDHPTDPSRAWALCVECATEWTKGA